MGLLNFFKKAQENYEIKTAERNKKIEEINKKLEDDKLAAQARIAENKAKLATKKSEKISDERKSTSTPIFKTSTSNTLTVKVTGTNYRNQQEILSLGKLNPDYSLNKLAMIKKYPQGIDVYEYVFPSYTASFEFEPTNEFDPNAIKVLIQGIHVGYVKKGSCARIKKLINQSKIESISAKIYGGNNKSLYIAGECDNKKVVSTDYEFENNSSDVHIILTLALIE